MMQAGACFGLLGTVKRFMKLGFFPRIRYILAAEGPVYLLLIFLTLLGRIIPVFQDSLNDYKSLDILIGAYDIHP